MSPRDPSAAEAAADRLIASLLRGETGCWPADAPGPDLLLDRVAFHGVAGLLEPVLSGVTGVPAALHDSLRARRIALLAWEARHRRRLAELLGAFDAAGIRPVILKGTACAYSVYAEPADRSRGDTDLLVEPRDRREAERILTSLGFRRLVGAGHEASCHQASYVRAEGQGWSHAIDLHWQVNNSAVLSRLFTPGELTDRAAALPLLAPGARGTDPADSVLIACFHRLVHLRSPYWVDGIPFFSADRLIWLCDIDRLARRMDLGDWTALLCRARAKALESVLLGGLRDAAEALGTPLPEGPIEALRAAPGPGAVDRYLEAGRLRRAWLNLRAQRGVREGLAFVGEQLFPPADYMRARFEGTRLSWLPLLYARRTLGGMAKAMRGQGPGT